MSKPLVLTVIGNDHPGIVNLLSDVAQRYGVDASTPPPAAGRRTVGHRNPFGDAFQSDNLMVDGDFELTGRTDQAPWTSYDPNQGPTTLNYDTGGHCRSGIRCATLAQPNVLVGYMASPLEGKMEVKLYAKVSSQKCADLQVFAVDFETGLEDKSVNPTSQAPAEDGWCLYAGEVDNLAFQQPVLYVSLGAEVTVTIDQVSVLPMGEASVHGALPPVTPVDAATEARIAKVAAWLRQHRKYGRGGAKTRGPQ